MSIGVHTENEVSALWGERDRLEESLSELTKTLEEYQDIVEGNNALVRAIQGIAHSVKTDSRILLEEDRLLRLGIVGQVNAGKSSLLNLLLFDGQEVLPQAATPMTASLTHIVKSDKDEIEVEHYSREDWEEIKRHAKEYQKTRDQQKNNLTDFLEASHELVEMVKKTRLTVTSYLGTTKVLPTSVGNLNRELRHLVGAEGELTPLVKSITIRCSQGIPDLDIVDTPGINDPIVSRSREAKKLLGRCDAVLLLSSATEFVNIEEVTFLQEHVVQAGIRQRLLIGSKFDSALIDESKRYRGDLQEAVKGLKQSLADRAKDIFEQSSDEDSSFAIKEKDILFVSAICSILAEKSVSQWSGDEQEDFDNLRRAYPDWLDEPEGDEIDENTRKTLEMLGNRHAVDEYLREVRRNKYPIILNKMKHFLQEKQGSLVEDLEELITDLSEMRKELRDSDLEGIQKQQEAVDEIEKEVGDKVSDTWEELIDQQAIGFDRLRETKRAEAKKAREEIKEAVGTHIKEGRRKRLHGKWNWLRLRSQYETYTYEEKVLEVSVARGAIEDMSEELDDEMKKLSKNLFSRDFARRASKQILEVISEELSSEVAHAIKPTTIKRSVRQTIDKIAEQARRNIGKQKLSFSTNIALSEDANRGQEQASKLVKSINEQVDQWINQARNQVETTIVEAKKALVPEATKELKSYLDDLKQYIEKQEFKLQRYKLAMDRLEQHLRELKQNKS